MPLVHALLCFLVRMPCLLATAWAWLRHFLAKSHVRWLEQRRKELSLRGLSGQSVATAAAEEITRNSFKPLVVSQLRRSTKKKNSSICLKKGLQQQQKHNHVLTLALRIPFDDLRDTSLHLFVEAICNWIFGEYFHLNRSCFKACFENVDDHLIQQIGGYDTPSHEESNQFPAHQLRDAPRQLPRPAVREFEQNAIMQQEQPGFNNAIVELSSSQKEQQDV